MNLRTDARPVVTPAPISGAYGRPQCAPPINYADLVRIQCSGSVPSEGPREDERA